LTVGTASIVTDHKRRAGTDQECSHDSRNEARSVKQ
jgi:hypothetical protein